MSTKTIEKPMSRIDEIHSQPFKLIVNNDDHNTFDWVITCLVKICQHEFEQASQCAHIIHFKGKCDVKYGSKEQIIKMKEKLVSAGLSATIEKN
jgi:ATP-dependent Clp protease adaptor protein ClpS